ncbi:MAG TPA: succinate dehydrogenase, cytochrome b556 subunit [Rhodospirillaceae bacterium]|nr:succinate dehydrogenase, cytochrome b556 subunit [Rhodospirillaceae bacterium]
MTPSNRPLSPHLLNYKFPLIVLLSGTHRATGVALSIGTLLLTYWLGSAVYGPAAFDRASGLLGSPIGYLVLFGFSFSLFYHLFNGIRHLLWDVGWGFELPVARKSGMVMVVCTLVCTLVTWAVALSH